MAHFKRNKTRRCVRCTMCTQFRWMGNSQKKTSHADRKKNLVAESV